MSSGPAPKKNDAQPPLTLLNRFLNVIELVGNKLPDPVLLFVWVLLAIWVLSLLLSSLEFSEMDPRARNVALQVTHKTQGENARGDLRWPAGAESAGRAKSGPVQEKASSVKGEKAEPGINPGLVKDRLKIHNQLTIATLRRFTSDMVRAFIAFPPLGLVLVSMLGVGVAEHVGLVKALLKGLLSLTPYKLLTPMLLLVALFSHIAGDAGFVVVIPLGGIIFATAGRHPLAGIAVAFAGCVGGFSACFVPTGLDPLLQGLTENAANILNPGYKVPVLCNLIFMAVSSVVIICVGWFITDRIIEPRLQKLAVDGNPADMPRFDTLTPEEKRGLGRAGLALLACVAGIVLLYWEVPNEVAGDIVPLIFIVFLAPGIAYGYATGAVKDHRDVVKGMTQSINTMSYYVVLAFFAALFSYAFNYSNVGVLLAVKGAGLLKAVGLPLPITIIGVILISTTVNLLIGSASAKWTLLAPVFVPMMMQLGLSPELTQAAYRIGDSSSNIITPLLPYFPLVVLYCQRYVKNTGIGTLISLMLPYSLFFLISWTILLTIFWSLGWPLGLSPEPRTEWYTYQG